MALILSRTDIQRCLNMTEAIDAMRAAFTALSAGHAEAPHRITVDLAEQGFALLMPALLQTNKQHAFGLKVITVMPILPLKLFLVHRWWLALLLQRPHFFTGARLLKERILML